jgi:hypothetical protein
MDIPLYQCSIGGLKRENNHEDFVILLLLFYQKYANVELGFIINNKQGTTSS